MLQWKDILNGARMIRNYRTSSRPRKDGRITRLWLEKPVLKTANLFPGTGIIVSIKKATIIQDKRGVSIPVVHIRAAMNIEVPTHTVVQKKGDPIIDIANADIDKVLGAGVKVDIVVKANGELFVYRELTFEKVTLSERPKFCSDHLRKYRVISLFCGSGGMTSGLVNTQACESVFAVDIDHPDHNPFTYEQQGKEPTYRAWAIETLQQNFPETFIYWGDIRSVHDFYIPKADIVCISPPCVEFSFLGERMEGLVEHFAFHIARIVLKSEARALFIENVENYFKSDAYFQIKKLLSPYFPYWYFEVIDSYDFGSLDTRRRGYVIAMKEQSSFHFPKPVKTPISRRKKVKDYLLEKEKRNWLPIKGTAMESIFGDHKEKFQHTGFTADRNATLVGFDDLRIPCITKGYSNTKATQSYILHPDGERWCLFTPEEIKNILHYPEWFEFPDDIPTSRYYELLGNSVNVRAIEAIASQLICALMECDIRRQVVNLHKESKHEWSIAVEQKANGQLEFVL
jgi:DNA-cytosine methyltransferase